MSAEHGSHGHSEETSVVAVIVSLLMGFLLAGEFDKDSNEVTQAVLAPDAAGHGH